MTNTRTALLELSSLLSRAADLASSTEEPRWAEGLRRLADRAADDAFFEVELDLREQSAFVLVGPLWNGLRPGGYYTDENQVPARWHVSAALSLAGIEHAARTPQPSGSTPAKRLRAAIDGNRSDVHTSLSHLDRVLAACRDAARG